MRNYKWGILGPGGIANKFADSLAVLPNAILYAVGSRDINRARAFAEKHRFEKAYGSYEALANDRDVDIIYVATRHPQHEEAVLTCLNSGKPVLCEKPFAVNARQASRMIENARKNNIFLMEAMWTRFLPSICKTRELISNGAIGNVLHIGVDFGFRADVDPNSRLFAQNSAGGSLLDVGVYNVSFCSMIMGKQPDRVQSHLNIGGTGVDESASMLFNYSEGQSAQLISSIRMTTPHEAAIYGEEGYIKLPAYWCGKTVVLNNKDGAREMVFPFEDAAGFQFEALEAMSCLDKGLLESPDMPLDETLAVMQTLDRIRFDNHLRYCFEEAGS